MQKANEIENQIDGAINPVQEGKKLRDTVGFGVTEKAALRIIYIFVLIYVLMFINNVLSLCSIVNTLPGSKKILSFYLFKTILTFSNPFLESL